jgi:hypothetical protein
MANCVVANCVVVVDKSLVAMDMALELSTH